MQLWGACSDVPWRSQAHRDKLKILNNVIAVENEVERLCKFDTRVHAEVTVADKFRSSAFEYFSGIKFIGCSKPSCFCCYHYLSALCPGFDLEGSHNKVYLKWQPIQVGQDRQAQEALNLLIRKVREECKDQVDRRRRTGIHHDTRTGTYSEAESSSEREGSMVGT